MKMKLNIARAKIMARIDMSAASQPDNVALFSSFIS
jgi:hypothetical protein